MAAARRFGKFLPGVVGDVMDLVPWQFQFDFRTTDGEIVLTSERELKVRDHYRLSLPAFAGGRQLDWRVAAAVGVALDTFQGR